MKHKLISIQQYVQSRFQLDILEVKISLSSFP
jgi:hypothetical protein